MKNHAHQSTPVGGFDLFRLSKSKDIVDISPNTLRDFNRRGHLNFYRTGKATFVSRAELDQFSRSNR